MAQAPLLGGPPKGFSDFLKAVTEILQIALMLRALGLL
jgi:hypothetical protein